MKGVRVIFFMMALAMPCVAQTQGHYAYLVPDGWEAIDTQFGDLNKDNVDDIAMIVQEKGDPNADDPPRSLIVAFKSADGYSEPYRADKVVLTRGQGGLMVGDPFQSMKIRRGTIVLSFYGGRRQRWGLTYIFRYQNQDFQLIGATSEGGDYSDGSTYKYDYNLSTERVVIERKYEQEPERNESKELIQFREVMPSMSSFTPWSLDLGDGVRF